MLTVDFDRLGLRPGDRLLDMGAGNGRHSYEALRRGARVVAFDLDVDALRDAAVMLGLIVTEEAPAGTAAAAGGNGLHLPFADGSFDRVVAAEVFEHIPDDGAAMRELLRVLRPGGTAAVTVPRFGPELVNWALSDEYHSNPGGHVRIYRPRQLVSRLRGAGFDFEGSGYAHALHSPYWWLKCALGLRNESALPVRLYHRMLVWEITTAPRWLRAVERAVNPLAGKSYVAYVRRPAGATTVRHRVEAAL